MQGSASVVMDHGPILEGLEVLGLIADRLEEDASVDPKDMLDVLAFLREVGCECIDHTAQLMLRPALERARRKEDIHRLRSAVSCSCAVQPLFEDLASDIGFRKWFVLHARLFSKLVSDLIFEEDHFLLPLANGLLNDSDGMRNVAEFTEHERRVRAIAAERISTLHRLETKYAHPLCI